MANIKFSAFTQKVVDTDVDFLVGYTGADNVRISPSTIGQGVYLPLTGGTMTGNILLEDSVKLSIGTSDDFNMFFNGVDTTLQNITGDLNILNKANDRDINLQTDNGSGGVATYIKLDGSTTDTYFLNPGNVGIGTSSPNYKLSVDDDSITNIPKTLLQFDAASIADDGGYNIDFRTSANDLANRYVARIRGIRESTGAKSQLSFWTESGADLLQRMTIRASGDVGIGTTSPVDKLHLEGGNARIETIGNTDVELILNPYSTALGTIFQWELVGKGSSGNYNFELRKAGNTYITVNSGASGTAGYVGIGTTSPGAKLEVRKGGTTAAQGDTDLIVQDSAAASSTSQVQILGGATGFSNLYFSDTSAYNVGGFIYNHSSNYLATNVNGSEKMRIDSSGNVGIGTTSPATKLHIADVSTPTIRIEDTTNNKNLQLFHDNNNSYIRSSTGSQLRFQTNGNNDRMLIDTSGNVGIGTSSPTEKLEVVGNIRIDSTSAAQLFLDSAAGNDSVINFQEGATQKAKIGYDNSLTGLAIVAGSGPYSTADMVILDGGNVGVGTTSPASKLEVDGGDIEITDSLNGLILKSPDGTRYRVTVANGGTLTVSAV